MTYVMDSCNTEKNGVCVCMHNLGKTMRFMFAKKRAKYSCYSSVQPALLIFVEIKAISRQNSNFQLLRKSSRANAVSEAWRSTKGPETADNMLFSIFSPFSSSIYNFLPFARQFVAIQASGLYYNEIKSS